MIKHKKESEQHTLFNTRDMRLFRFTALFSASIILMLIIVIFFWTLAKAIGFFSHLLMPLAVAGILSLVLLPVVCFIEKHLHVKRVLAISILYLGFVLFLAGFLILLVPSIIDQAAGFAETAPAMFAELQTKIANFYPGLTTKLSAKFEQGSFDSLIPEANKVGEFIKSYLGMLSGLAFIPLYLFFALLSGDLLRNKGVEFLSIFKTETQDNVIYFVDVFIGYVTAFFQGQLVIGVLMGILFAIGFSAIGLQLSIPIGLMLGLMNVVPFLGTIVGLIIVLPMTLFQPEGGYVLLMLAILVFAVVQFIESWFLTPKIMSDRSGLHPGLVVISIFFWGTALGGIIGMVLAVPLTAFFVAIWHPLKAGLIRSLASDEK